MNQSEQWQNVKNFKLNSPKISRQLKTCLSFASVKQHKIIQQQQTPRNNLKKILNTYKSNEKQIKDQYVDTKTKQQHKNKQSAIKSNSKIVIQSYQIQNQSLKQTVQILKQQIQTLSNSYQTLKKRHKILKQTSLSNQNKLKQSLSQIQVYKNKQKQFQSIMPKIEELEQLQDLMILQNGKLKGRENLLKDLLVQIFVITGDNLDQTALQVRRLIQERCRKLQ